MTLKINSSQGNNPQPSPNPSPNPNPTGGQGGQNGQGNQNGQGSQAKTNNNQGKEKYPYTGKQMVQFGFIAVLGVNVLIAVIKNKKIGKLSVIILAIIITAGIEPHKVEAVMAKAFSKVKNHENIITVVPDKTTREITYDKLLEIVEIDSKISEATAGTKKLEKNDLITTGTKIKTENGKTYTAVVYGDVNQDGKVNATDIGKIIENNTGKETLTGVTKKAANLANKGDQEDKTIDTNDIKRLKKYILRNTDEQIVEELPTELDKPDPNPVNPEMNLTGTMGSDTITVTVSGTNLEEGATYKYYIREQKDSEEYELKNTSTNKKYVFTDLKAYTNYLVKVEYQDSKNNKLSKEKTFKTDKISVTGITLDKSDEIINVGETLRLTPTIQPENASVKEIRWTSSNNGVATVENGVVTGKTEGIADITATTVDGEHTATCKVHVTIPIVEVTGVTLNTTGVTIKPGATTRLVENVLPENATNKAVRWSSDNEAVATVENGVVTGKTVGRATITVTTESNNKTATCEINVQNDVVVVTGITLDKQAKH